MHRGFSDSELIQRTLIICYICGMDKDRAQQIADEYCSKVSEYRHAVYGGEFDGGFLFSLDFQGSGHHGMPIFVIVRPNAGVERLEKHSEKYNRAWNAFDKYVESL